MLQAGMNSFKNRLLIIALVALAAPACTGKNENSHTTATTFVSPPPRQILQAVAQPSKQIPAKPDDLKKQVDPDRALMIFNFVDKAEVHGDSPVVIDFSLANPKLKGDGGEYRVRYIVDDDEMKWIDRWEQIVLTGWTAGKHTIRVELIGPDGWPYKNGDYNIETRELTVIK
jgi:hypothetical protein